MALLGFTPASGVAKAGPLLRAGEGQRAEDCGGEGELQQTRTPQLAAPLTGGDMLLQPRPPAPGPFPGHDDFPWNEEDGRWAPRDCPPPPHWGDWEDNQRPEDFEESWYPVRGWWLGRVSASAGLRAGRGRNGAGATHCPGDKGGAWGQPSPCGAGSSSSASSLCNCSNPCPAPCLNPPPLRRTQ